MCVVGAEASRCTVVLQHPTCAITSPSLCLCHILILAHSVDEEAAHLLLTLNNLLSWVEEVMTRSHHKSR